MYMCEQAAFFNGIGFNPWENVWGVFNAMSGSSSALLRRAAALLRYFQPFLTTAWEPHVPLHAATGSSSGVFASAWRAAPGAVYTHNATLYTLVNRVNRNMTSEPTVLVPCDDANAVYFDAYHGVEIFPTPLLEGGCALSLDIEAMGLGAVLCVAALDVTPDLRNFLSSMAALTARSLASFPTDNAYANQTMMDNGRTSPLPSAPPGMQYIPGNASWRFTVSGTEIEPFAGNCIGAACARVDVQFPWETTAVRTHAPVNLNVPGFYMDTVPTTNAAFSAFLMGSAYWPGDDHNFVRDWECSGSSSAHHQQKANGVTTKSAQQQQQASAITAAAAGASSSSPGALSSLTGVAAPASLPHTVSPRVCTYPPGWDDKPVTWVSLEDARAFCGYNGKRLPNDWEWQRAAQGDDGRIYPWGSTNGTSGFVPAAVTGRNLTSPDASHAHPSGASPFGVLDMVGNIWQWTNEFRDAHTRGGLQRGGSYYEPQGSNWYYPRSLRVDTHNKWLMWAPSYDRAGTVGFRCAADAAAGGAPAAAKEAAL